MVKEPKFLYADNEDSGGTMTVWVDLSLHRALLFLQVFPYTQLN